MMRSPAGAGMTTEHARRMIRFQEPPEVNLDAANLVAEIAQFLSTLIIVQKMEITPEEEEELIKKLKAWRAKYQGYFAVETTNRCLMQISPEG